jgi:hypothetical protein
VTAPSFAVRIMHVRDDAWRRANVVDLRRHLGPVADFAEVVDPTRRGCLRTFLDCIGRPTKGASHVIVLCDDSGVFPPQLTPELSRAMAALPAAGEAMVCLAFTHQAVADMAAARQTRWAIGRGVWMYGLVIPAPVASRLYRWIKANIDPAYPHDDTAVSAWCEEHRADVWYPIPCLIDHVGADRSLLGHGHRSERRPPVSARWTAPVDDWALGVDRPVPVRPMVGHYANWLAKRALDSARARRPFSVRRRRWNDWK